MAELTDTGLKQVSVDLAKTIGGNTGDGATDQIIINGSATGAGDKILVTAVGGRRVRCKVAADYRADCQQHDRAGVLSAGGCCDVLGTGGSSQGDSGDCAGRSACSSYGGADCIGSLSGAVVGHD